MSEAPETPIATATPPAPADGGTSHQGPWVFRAAAWVAIVAGIVFIVSVIFFTGFALGRHAGHGGCHHGHHKHHAILMRPGAPNGGPAAANPGAPAGPAQVPSTVAPTATSAPRTP
ncbi:hypothetical protein [Mycobacterium lacus]|nr:hypothetical protein [Mycobacterium lacus]